MSGWQTGVPLGRVGGLCGRHLSPCSKALPIALMHTGHPSQRVALNVVVVGFCSRLDNVPVTAVSTPERDTLLTC